MADDSYAIEHSYFEEQDDPYVDESDRTYTDADRPLVHRLSFQWNHSIGEIVTALIRNGLRLEWLEEHDWTVWPRWDWLVKRDDGSWVAPPGMAGRR